MGLLNEAFLPRGEAQFGAHRLICEDFRWFKDVHETGKLHGAHMSFMTRPHFTHLDLVIDQT